MSRKLLYYIGITCLVITIVASIVHTLNPAEVEVHPWYDLSWKTSLANVMLGYFLFGAMAVGLVALLLELSNAFRVRLLSRQLRKMSQSFDRLLKAREAIALGAVNDGLSELRAIVSGDEKNTLAHLSLVRSLLESGRLEESLRAVNHARTRHSANKEILLLAAELGEKMGNDTLAYDNLSLALSEEQNSTSILRRLVDVAVRLRRYNEAIGFQTRLIKLTSDEEHREAQKKLADLETCQVLETSQATSERIRLLQAVLNRHRNHHRTLDALASELQKEGKTEEARKLYIQAYKLSAEPSYLERLALSALAQGLPQSAIELVHEALAEAARNKLSVISGKIVMIQLLLHLEKVEEAHSQLTTLDRDLADSATFVNERKLLWALVHRHRGELNKSTSDLFEIAQTACSLPAPSLSTEEKSSASFRLSPEMLEQGRIEPPAPQYSTP